MAPKEKDKPVSKKATPVKKAEPRKVKEKKAAAPELKEKSPAPAGAKEKKPRTKKVPAEPKAEKKAKIPKKEPAEKKIKPKAIKPAKEEKVKAAEKIVEKHKEAKEPEVKEKKHEVHIKPPSAEPVIEQKAEVPQAVPKKEEKKHGRDIRINELTTIREIAEKLGQTTGDVIKKLLSMGTLATINQRIDLEVAELLASEYGFDIKFASIFEGEKIAEEEDDVENLKPRPAVVTIMGHVNHGKTSLLDAIRETDVASKEAGGITQHIGAYKVKTAKGEVTFLDTPGHEAFTAMRSRGAQVTDIVVLVVAADDGVMPQTVEALDHARAAAVPIIVAINKIDVPGANPSQVKQELTKYNLLSEDWGGDTIMVEVSAKNNIKIDALLEMILLKAEMMELKANPDTLARGAVVEARLDHKRGPVITVLIQKGTLHVGDNFIVGTTYGKVRAMTDDHGKKLDEAKPVTPVEILGVNSLPHAGDRFIAMDDERKAREIAQTRFSRAREERMKPRHHLSLEDISSGKVKELRLVLKADVQGSLGALRDSLDKLSTPEIKLTIIHGGIGTINESDVTLAAASDAIIMGFSIKPDTAVERMAEREGVSIRIYRIIYEVIADVRAAMEGMLEPQLKEISLGKAQVRQVFKISKVGTIAGCSVLEGKIQRGCKVRILRDNVIIYDGNIITLRRFKDDVKEVDKGFECGIGLERYSDFKNGDILDLYTFEKIARKLEDNK
ncbi:MAG: translation initiation factor IF-2 [Elusimicrobia bacterium]|nr:translation initiation factor IF-2 [Candidatus Liberimonas magnetica]